MSGSEEIHRDLGRLEGRVEQIGERMDEHARESRDTSARIEGKLDAAVEAINERANGSEGRMRRLEKGSVAMVCALIALIFASSAIPNDVVKHLVGFVL